MTALGGLENLEPPKAIADSSTAKTLRSRGWRVENTWTTNQTELEEYASRRGIWFLALNGQLIDLKTKTTSALETL